jgi:glutamate-ammonia-ligase adenylyltransferase
MGLNMSQLQKLYKPLSHNNEKTDEITAKIKEYLSVKTPNCHFTKQHQEIIEVLFSYSPYLSSIALRDTEFTAALIFNGVDNALSTIFTKINRSFSADIKITELMEKLRELKGQIALTCALADLTSKWPLHQITETLSNFAATTLHISLTFLLYREVKKGNIALPLPDSNRLEPSICNDCGFFLLGMGKLGANELNYSSDIDLIALYNPEKIDYLGKKTIGHFFVGITQELMQIIERRTMHGYVFRTDLRLRPDPGSTPVAISILAAETYYHTVAANWERSAMIKAMPIAGDIKEGKAYMASLSSWIWRRSMDFAAIQDIAAIKNHLNQHYKQTDKEFAGFDVKLGRGGIREIEFFAQINQLLYGGRHPALRVRGTLETLHTLVDEGLLSANICQKLSVSYEFLRTLEHRLQMVNDEQTHIIPTDMGAVSNIAGFMGFETSELLKTALKNHTDYVHEVYQNLLPNETNENQRSFSQGQIEQKFNELGYTSAKDMMNITASWRSAKYRALRTNRSQKLLEECIPTLIEAFAATSNPDSALSRFDIFLSKLPAGVQLFALFQANPSLFALMARVMGLAPALAETLAKKPLLWELLLEPNFFEPIENKTLLTDHLKNMIARARDYQDILDMVRQFAEEYKFRIGVQLLESIATADECMKSLALIADVTLELLVPEVEREFETRYGQFNNAGIAILAMGKYGGHELTHTSDLDIVFLYYVDDMKSYSNGGRSLGPSQYYSRLGQNIITSITALTAEGRLFEVDTRLRPSGNQGPLVVTLDTFHDYYSKDAWTWEHMALTRARVIKEPEHFSGELISEIRKILTNKRDQKSLVTAVSDMRQKLNNANKTDNPWALKHIRGGLIDIEFICQYLLLKEGEKHYDIFASNMDTAFENLAAKSLLEPVIGQDLINARHLMQNVQSILRLCMGDKPTDEISFSPGLKEILCRSTKYGHFEDLKENLLNIQAKIYKHFEVLIDIPAKRVKDDNAD